MLDKSQMRRKNVVLCLLGLGLLGCLSPVPVEQAVPAPKATAVGNGPTDLPSASAQRPPQWPTVGPMGLPIPVFTPSAGAVAFGDSARLSVSKLPAGAVLEYSADSGRTWISSDRVPVVTGRVLLGRTRINQLTSNPAQAVFRPYFRRMLVIGNSIMSHGPAPELGWLNTNGMAASAPEKDFVHLLMARLRATHAPATVRLQSGGNFERNFGRATYSLDEFNAPLQQFKPDLIIVRLGENVDEGEVRGTRNFEGQFRRLLEYLTATGRPVKLICTTSVWHRPQADALIRKVTTEKGHTLVELSSLVGRGQYFASQYANAGVAAHPNDAGMQRIADLIWEQVP